jgi:hypothetical protein
LIVYSCSASICSRIYIFHIFRSVLGSYSSFSVNSQNGLPWNFCTPCDIFDPRSSPLETHLKYNEEREGLRLPPSSQPLIRFRPRLLFRISQQCPRVLNALKYRIPKLKCRLQIAGKVFRLREISRRSSLLYTGFGFCGRGVRISEQFVEIRFHGDA